MGEATGVPRDVDDLLDAYGLRGRPARSVAGSHSGVWRVSAPDGDRCLKVVRGESERALRSQVAFMDHLRTGGVPVIEVLPTRDGDVVAVGDGCHATLQPWLEGVVRHNDTDPAVIELCGELLARMHRRARDFDPPADFERVTWDEVYAPGDRCWLQDFLAADRVSDTDARRILEVAAEVRDALAAVPRDGGMYGVGHADLHSSNIVRSGDRVTVIDFEDCGWTHTMVEIHWPAAFHAQEHGMDADFLGPFLHGYRRCQEPPTTDPSLDRIFHRAAGLAVLEMVHSSHVDQDGDVARRWRAFAMEWLEG